MAPKQIKSFCAIDGKSKNLLEMAVDRLGFSARAINRIIKIARTIADLKGDDAITEDHISEAIGYRVLDKG